MGFLQDAKKAINNQYAEIASNGIKAGDITGTIDSGSYWLNALLSGSIYGGYPNSKITMLAAPSGVGKTFLVIAAMRTFLENNPENAIFLFESESALTKDFLVSQGIDTKRVLVIPVVTVEEFRHQALTILTKYHDLKVKDNIMFVLDSLGMLSTNKEVNDSTEGKDTKDMTRAGMIKSAFRLLTLKMGVVTVPLLVTNHVYAAMSLYGGDVVGGGCLVRDTKIKGKDGNISIQDVKVGDNIQTVDGTGICTETFEFNDKDLYEVEFEDGSSIKCSSKHLFLYSASSEWVSAEKLKVGDDLQTV